MSGTQSTSNATKLTKDSPYTLAGLTEMPYKASAKILHSICKACQAEVVSQSVEKEAQYPVNMRWGYELGKLSLQAAGATIQQFDERTKIYTLKSGRQVLPQNEDITMPNTAEIAQTTTNAINRKGFCSNQKVLKPTSYIPRVLNRAGMKFTEKPKTHIIKLR